MSPELQSALAGLVAAIAALVWAEVRYRTNRREQRLQAAHVRDVQRKVGADRRRADTTELEALAGPPGALPARVDVNEPGPRVGPDASAPQQPVEKP